MAGVAGCTVDDLAANGKRCPCGEGAVCDPCTDTCVAPETLPERCDNDPLAAVRVSNLRGDWATPNVVQWSWDLGIADDPDQLASFRLVIAESEEDVLSESGTARVFTAAENPELGRYLLPRAESPDPVVKTQTDGLEPTVSYFARLFALDTSGRVSSTNIATRLTQDEAIRGELVVFADQAVPLTQPDDLSLGTDCGVTGDGCYQWQQSADCDSGCFENLRLSDLSIDLGGAIQAGPFETSAYLEFAIAVDAAAPSYWSDARLWLRDMPGTTDAHAVRALTFRTSSDYPGYRTHQLPLRVFRSDKLLTYEDLSLSLEEFGIGGTWVAGATVRIDSVRIVW